MWRGPSCGKGPISVVMWLTGRPMKPWEVNCDKPLIYISLLSGNHCCCITKYAYMAKMCVLNSFFVSILGLASPVRSYLWVCQHLSSFESSGHQTRALHSAILKRKQKPPKKKEIPLSGGYLLPPDIIFTPIYLQTYTKTVTQESNYYSGGNLIN